MANPTSPPGRARGSYAKTPARRAEIVRAGFEVFSSGGYNAASLRVISDKVGLSQAGLLHHFANKWELLEAVLTLRDEESLALLPARDGTSGIDVIRSLLDLVAHNMLVPGIVELHCVLSAEATHSGHPAHAYFANRYRFVVGLVTDAFTDMSARGELLPGIDPRSAAVRLVAMMDGLQVQWLLDRDALDMSVELRRHVQSLCTARI